MAEMRNSAPAPAEIPQFTDDLYIIQKLDDQPNDVGGLTAEELKLKFDEGPNRIKEYINGTMIPALFETIAVEQAREAAENERIENEAGRVAAEEGRVLAEAQRTAGESAREEAEADRESAENDRRDAEIARRNAEQSRSETEQGRVNAEDERAIAETARAAAESARAAAEVQRVSEESARAAAEVQRSGAENDRQTAETARELAESARVNTFAGMQAEAVTETQAANTAARRITNLGMAAATLAPESPATVDVTVGADGGLKVALGIPRGPQGIPGQSIVGPKGDTGKGFAILGFYASEAALRAAVSDPAPGDAYGVGTEAPYDIYIYDAIRQDWVNDGPLSVVQVALDGIAIEQAPDTVSYLAGESFDPTGMVVSARYNGGALTGYATGFRVSPAGPLPAETEAVTVLYSEGTTTKSAVQPITVAWREAAVPAPVGDLTYNGSAQAPSWPGYDPSIMSMSGRISATEAGTYETTFTLLYPEVWRWADHDGGERVVEWTIEPTLVAIPTMEPAVFTYDGTAQGPVLTGLDVEKVLVTGEATAVNAGQHTITLSLRNPDSTLWTDGTTEPKTIVWSIQKAQLTPPVVTGTSFTYNGSAQGPTISGYDSATMTQSGATATNAGSYTVSHGLRNSANYEWNDGTVAAKTVEWSIAKAAGSLSVSPMSVTLNSANPTASVVVDRAGDGAISASVPGSSIVTATVSGDTVTIASNGQQSGSAEVVISVAEGTNHLAPESVVVPVTASFITIYGVEWDWTSSGPTKGTRTDAAAGFSDPSPAVNNGTGSSPFDGLMPWAGMVKETRTGGVMVKEPKYWFKWTKAGKKLKLQIADGPVEGFHVDPVNMDRGDGLGELDFSYIARYHCGTSDWKSTTNVAQKVNITRSAARTGIHGLGTYIWQMDFAQMWYVGMLYLVEFADWNGQAKIGYGCSASNYKKNNGKTDAMQYHTGTTEANRTTYGYTQYRNIEGWWDNVYDWMDGCYYNSNGLNVIMNPANWSDSSGGVLVGKPTGGYPSEFAIPTQSGLEWALYPIAASGSTTTYVPDSWYVSSGSSPCLLHGGSYGQDQIRGPFYVDYYGTSNSSVSIGCRLQERPPKAA